MADIRISEIATTATAPTRTTTMIETDHATRGSEQLSIANLLNIVENAQTGTSYIIIATDEHKLVTMNNGSGNTLDIPLNATTAFQIGTVIHIGQLGAGQTTVTAAIGVTINSLSSNIKITSQFGRAMIIKTATDTWFLSGDLAA